jgi:hypothetical protein
MLAFVVAAVLGADVTAAPPESVNLRAAMHRYYDGEYAGGYAWSTSGGLSVAAAVPMLLSTNTMFKAMGIPTIAFGAAQLGLGIASFFTAPARIRKFDAQLDTNAPEFLATEGPRLRGIGRAFTVFQLVEVGIIAGASGLMGAGYARRDDAMVGVGLGLVVQSLLFLLLDEVASRRADTYVTVLDDFLPR